MGGRSWRWRSGRCGRHGGLLELPVRRSKDQRMADALAILLLGADDTEPARPAKPTVAVQVTVDLPTLLHLRQHPGELLGYGPIPAEIARELAGDATWQRFVHEPVTGYLLDAGDERYQPPPAITRFRVARDVRCRFPGSTRRARDGDGDHVEPHRDGGGGGRTSSANLPPCPSSATSPKPTTAGKSPATPTVSSPGPAPTAHLHQPPPRLPTNRRRPTTVLMVGTRPAAAGLLDLHG